LDAVVTKRSMLVKPTKRKYEKDVLQRVHHRRVKECHRSSGKGNSGRCFFTNELTKTNVTPNLTKSSHAKILFYLKNKMLSENSLKTSKDQRLRHIGNLTQTYFRKNINNHAHANTHWRKTLSLPEVWKKIIPVHSLENTHANIHWGKNILLSESRRLLRSFM